MNTYAMHVPAGLLIDVDTAVAINLKAMAADEPEAVPDELMNQITEHGTWNVVDANLVPSDLLEELSDVQLAMEYLEGTADCVFASEFTGTAETLDKDKDEEPVRTWDYDDDFVAIIECDREVSPFQAAYDDMSQLVTEFRDKLASVLGPDYPYRGHVVTLTGTYYC